MTTAQIPKLVGTRVKRREDPRLITGNATYVDDLKLPNMQYMALLRSPYAHARVTSIDISAAKAMPGVIDVITGDEVKGMTPAMPTAAAIPDLKVPQRWPLATGEVRYVGEPVVAILARDRYTARDAVDLIEVEYEQLPAVADVEKAYQDGAPPVHADIENNVAYYMPVSTGDIEQAFKDADVVVKQRMVNQRLYPTAMEERGIVASYNKGEESLTVWASTQNPHLLKSLLAAILNVPEHKTRVIAPEVGGGFGCKITYYGEDLLASALSIKTGRPVKWVATRIEGMMSTTHGRDHIAYGELAAMRDGTLVGYKLHILSAMGAYHTLLTAAIPTFSALMAPGCYKIPNVFLEVHGVFTNTVPTDAYRGAGRPEATYYIERMMDVLADELGMDPADLRRKNFPRPDEFPYTTPTGLVFDSGDYEKSLDKMLEIADYQGLRRTQEQQRNGNGDTLTGIGLATWVEICGIGPSAASPGGTGWEMGAVRVERSGTVTVMTGVSPHGQGQETSFAQIVADELGVPIENVVVLHGDTAVVTQGVGTYGSRGLVVGGPAIMMSVNKIKDKAKRWAAHLMDANVDDLIYEDGRVSVQGSPDRGMSLAEIARVAWAPPSMPQGEEPGLTATSFFEPGNFTFPFGAHLAVVQIEKATGKINLARYVAVDDCGRVISPLLVAGQLHGGIAQGAAQALCEEVVYDDDGQLLTGTLMDYAVPTAEMFPRFELDHTETLTPVNPLGAKGVGEAGTIAATPTIVNAVVDALSPYGVTHVDMMLKPEKIWQIIKQAEKGGSAS